MKKYTYQHIKEYLEKEGYKLLLKEYKDSHTKLDMMCSKNHKLSLRFLCFSNRDQM